MPDDQQRINVPALVLLAVLTGGTASFAGIKFSWVPTDASAAREELRDIKDEIKIAAQERLEIRASIEEESETRKDADVVLSSGAEKIYREFIILRERCRYLDRRCERLERGHRNDTTEY